MIVVTGCTGFIGFHLAERLLRNGCSVIGIDCVNSYYDVNLKEDRLKILQMHKNFCFYKQDICNYKKLEDIYKKNNITKTCHLAAQAGIRHSLTNPFDYQKSNNEGFLNMIECCRHHSPNNFVFASSSSVYGGNKKLPFSEKDRTDMPISLYAVTKKSNELTAHAYSHLFDMNCSGMRFFTAYGPWGRPDMALFIFTKAILEDRLIEVFNDGKMWRNFTYIDDIIDGILLVMDNPQPYEIYNIGSDRTEPLMDLVDQIETRLGRKAKIEFKPMQLGDITRTKIDLRKISKLGYKPKHDITYGVERFIDWYKEYYKT